MTREKIIAKALSGKLSWAQAAALLSVTERHMRRLRRRVEQTGLEGLVDGRSGPRKKRVPESVIAEVCRLRRELYRDFSIRHFHDFLTTDHALELSYSKTKSVVQAAGLAMKISGRGKYRRARERRPMRGMMLHLDGSEHAWIEGLPKHDLMVVLDDATSETLYARFFEEEAVIPTLDALKNVVAKHGRFSELYTDRGSSFVTTTNALRGPNVLQNTELARVLYALRIKHIRAYSPQARGRSERFFRTIQGRLPQELRLHKITTYAEANTYLEAVFISALNVRFSVRPAQPESAFTPVEGIDLDLLFSVQHTRMVRNDNTVLFDKLVLQLKPDSMRHHYTRCEVIVHEFTDGELGVSYDGRLLMRCGREGLKQREFTKNRKLPGPSKRKNHRTSLKAYDPGHL
jgi:transposase